MINRYKILIIILVASGQVLSQDQANPCRIEIGITAGFRLSGIQLDYDQSINASDLDYIPKGGYQVGIPLNCRFQKRLSLQSGALFINDNAQAISNMTTGYGMQSHFNFKWVGIPMALRYDILRIQNHKLFIGGGLCFNRLLSAQNRITITQNSTATTNEFNLYDIISPWNVMGKIQFGADFTSLPKFPLSIVLSFDKTLTNMVEEVDSGNNPLFDFTTVQGDMRLHSFSIALFYFFQ